MNLHILGICGTFMGGIAVLAREAGHLVQGSDQNVFPPMSSQLQSIGIHLHEGYSASALQPSPDVVVVGNVMSRGNPAIEYMLDNGLDYTSGPQWLAQHVLRDRHVLAVAGTHGKTSTASMLAWILEFAGMKPGFLIGGIPVDFGVSARLGESKYFVVEADEYDTAFFDKRSKFVHYRPDTLVITNLEFDHADIFPDMAAIRRQFHHLLRTVPGNGRIIVHTDEDEIEKVIDLGCWTPVETYGGQSGFWSVTEAKGALSMRRNSEPPITASGAFAWPGQHNMDNALAACAAASHAGVSLQTSLAALGCWRGVRRRLEHVGTERGISIYDDFAHHPTEIAATLQAMRSQQGEDGRIIAVFEPRSNSMKLGVHAAALGKALGDADVVFLFDPPGLQWDLRGSVAVDAQTVIMSNLVEFTAAIVDQLQPGDRVVFMSNGSFGGLPAQLLDALH